MAGTKRKSTGSYKRTSPKKAKYKSAKSVFKFQRFKSGGPKSKSRRKWLIKHSRKGKLRGRYQSRSLTGKDAFHPTNEQGCVISINKQLPSGPSPLNPALATQQMVMNRKYTTHMTSSTGKQAHETCCHMMNAIFDPTVTAGPDASYHIPNMWNIGMKTSVDAGSYSSLTNPSAMVPTLEFMRRQSLYVKSFRVNFTIVNPTNADVTLTINQVRPRHDEVDATQTPVDVWFQAALNNDNQDTDVTTLTNFGPYNSADNWWQVGNKPTTNKQYNAQFGTSHSKTMKLAPGQIYNYTLHIKYNKYMKWEDVYPTLPGSGAQGSASPVKYFLQHWTQWTQFIFHGQPAEDTSSNNVVTYAPSALNMFIHETTKFYMCPLRPITNYNLNEVSSSPAQGTLRTVQADGDFVVPQEVSNAPLFAQAASYATSTVAATGNQIYSTTVADMTA